MTLVKSAFSHSPAAPARGQGDGRHAADSPAGLLTLLLEKGPLSRSELATALGLSRPTLTELSRHLLDLGLIREQAAPGRERRSKGRPSINLELNPDYGVFAGVQVSSGAFSLVLTDLRGQLLTTLTAPASPDIEGLSRDIGAALDAACEAAGLSRKQVRRLGIALSGYVDHASGVCWQSANLGWYDVPVAQIVAQATGLPTSLENDAKAAALGEKLFGVARDTADFTLVTLGESVGAAHFINGGLYRGQTGAAGELAHCTVNTGPSARLCRCGKRGCLDTVASATALLAQAHERGIAAQSVTELEALAVQGHGEARALLQEAAQALGLVLSFVAQSHDPALLILADLSGFSQGYFLTLVRQTIENNILPRLLSTFRVELHPVTPDFWARGAAGVAIQQLFHAVGS